MASITRTNEQQETQHKDYPASSIRYDFFYAAMLILFTFGMFLDGWAHSHGRVDDTFLTPWHAVLYGSYALIGLVLFGTWLFNINRGYSFTRALPKGYWLSLIGILIFAFAGAADMVWHETFGFEEDIEALLSPSHLALALGAFLFVTGPIRSAWLQGGREKSPGQFLPAIISWAALLSLFTFFTQFASLDSNMLALTGSPRGDTFLWDVRGIAGILISVALMIGVVLMMLRRWQLPFGTLTIMFTFNGALMTWIHIRQNEDYAMIVVFFLAGLLGDVLIRWLNPTIERVLQLRIVAFAIPFILALGFMAGLHYGSLLRGGAGLRWAIHMWLGAPIMAAIVGLFLSYLLVAPQLPEGETA